ncbi:MAG: hypothetical protein D6765_09240, partial [Bacteroidetes bacterium]
IQPGDVPATFADVSDLVEDLQYKPDTPVEEGVKRFVGWYLDFFQAPSEANSSRGNNSYPSQSR